MTQHKEDTINMAAAIRNISFHASNHYENCGSWCGFKNDPNTYIHKAIPGGFKNENLFEELKIFFKLYSRKCY